MDSPTLSDRDKVALLWADAVTENRAREDDELFSRLQQHFDTEAIVELTMLVAYRTMVNRFVEALGLELEGPAAQGEDGHLRARLNADEGRKLLRSL